MCQRGERESPPEILGKAILVISGQGRKMYQYLEPKPEGTILPKRSMPQEAERAPHDTGTSMANWLEWNIQGGEVALTPRRPASAGPAGYGGIAARRGF